MGSLYQSLLIQTATPNFPSTVEETTVTTIWDDIKNQFSSGSILTRLILVNVAVFVTLAVAKFFAFITGTLGIYEDASRFLMLPNQLEVLLYQPWTLVSYFFTHEDIWHILFNMLFLYYFGQVIEEFIGARRLLAVYLLGGLAGGVTFLVLMNTLPVLQSAQLSLLVGASGAVYAAVVGAATLVPNYTFNLILLGPVRIVWIAVFYILLSMLQFPNNPGGNLAHLGGALMGFLYISQLRRGTDLGKGLLAVTDWLSRIFSSGPTMKVSRGGNNDRYGGRSPVSSPPSGGSSRMSSYNNQLRTSTRNEVPTEAEVDRILDKIAKQGVDSLTKEEKQTLDKASSS